MAENQGTADTLGDWQAMSRQYWDQWADATRGAFGATATATASNKTPWHEGLEQWARLFATRTPADTQSDVVERLLAGARSYFALLQKFAGQATEGNPDSQAWAAGVRDAFNFPGADAAFWNNPLATALRELAGHGAKGFDEMLAGIQPTMDNARALLDLPAFGLARERQEGYQQAAKAWLDYQHATHRYNVLIAKASQRAFVVFEDKLAEHAEPGRQIDSVRGLYNVWVDAAEEAYAEVALSDEFRTVYGALVNAQMRVRQGVQKAAERAAGELGMPTRTEVDTIGQRLHALRREARNRAEQDTALQAEVAALRDEVKRRAKDNAALGAELAALRGEVKALRTTPRVAAPVRKAPVRAPRRKAPAKSGKPGKKE